MECSQLLREADVTNRRGANLRLSEMDRKTIDDTIEARLRTADQQRTILQPSEHTSLPSGLGKLLLDQTQSN